MSEASELRMDHKKYLQRCRERGLAHIAKMTPEELAALIERVKELEKLDPKKIFFDVHEVPENVVLERPRCEDMLIDQQEK